ncbi:MAG TPA: hypothetical protein VNX29_04370 [Kaistia sp.]|nr:hypothetical protein [Kaistia sp.]
MDNQAPDTLSAAGSIEGVDIVIDPSRRHVVVTVTLVSADLAEAYFRDLYRECRDTGVLHLGSRSMRVQFGEIEQERGNVVS